MASACILNQDKNKKETKRPYEKLKRTISNTNHVRQICSVPPIRHILVGGDRTVPC
jgi:hypothetical protein